MKVGRGDAIKKLENWFDLNGKVISTSTGNWARGYLEHIADMLITEVEKAYQKGLEDGAKKREDQGNTKTVRRQSRKQDRVR